MWAQVDQSLALSSDAAKAGGKGKKKKHPIEPSATKLQV